MAEPTTDLTLDSASLLASEEHEIAIVGRSPWYLAWRRLRRNWVALAALVLFVLIVVACALAPVYAHHIAHTGPTETHPDERIKYDGKTREVIGGGGFFTDRNGNVHVKPVTVLGPCWWHCGGKFVLGADQLGRDVAVRLLYGVDFMRLCRR